MLAWRTGDPIDKAANSNASIAVCGQPLTFHQSRPTSRAPIAMPCLQNTQLFAIVADLLSLTDAG
jgi:hypothetical protein|tara:strand:- start:425 stop:619 length:195 start_codon:yes stop_codon:yes gene_type:complete